MYCSNCGAMLPDNAAFCPECGTKVTAEESADITVQVSEPVIEEAPAVMTEPAEEAPVFEPVSEPETVIEPEPVNAQPPVIPVQPAPQPVYAAPKEDKSTPALVWGIIGIAFSSTLWFGLLGLIFSKIGRNKYAEYLETVSVPSGKGKVGGILSKIGVILGIIGTVCVAIIIFCGIIIARLD